MLRLPVKSLMPALVMTLFLLSTWQVISSVQIVRAGDVYRAHFESRLTTENANMDNGKKEMEMLVKRAKMPHVGECWKDALENLRVSCSQLDDEMQSRLALSFTSCYTEMIGSPNHICDRSTPIKTCLGALDVAEKEIFRDYFLHTQDMCYFIQSELWHQETDRAVNELQFAAIEMAKTVFEQKSIADSILESQQTSHSVQKEMIRENFDLFEKVINIKTTLEEFGANAAEHQVIFMEIFEKLRKMQELVIWIQGEMSLIDLVVFYSGSVLLSYFLTTSERAQSARVWMILNIAASLFLERYLYGAFADERDMTPDEILLLIGYFRRLMGAITGLIFFVHVAKYRDYDSINNTLLTDMGKRMDAMMEFWEEHVKYLPQPQQPIPVNVATVGPALLPLHQEEDDSSDCSVSTDGDDNDKLMDALGDSESSSEDEEAEEPANNPLNLMQVGGKNQLETAQNGGIPGIGATGVDTLENGGVADAGNASEGLSGDESEWEQPTPPGEVAGFFQRIRLLNTGGTVQTIHDNAHPEQGATGSTSDIAVRYNLRDRKTLTLTLFDKGPEGGKAKVNKRKKAARRPTTGYFSSDDEI